MYSLSTEQDRLLRMQIRSPKSLSEISVPGYEHAGATRSGGYCLCYARNVGN